MQTQTQTPERYTSIDPDEVEQFSRIAAQWWDPKGKFKPLHEINPLRIGYIKEHICSQFAREVNALSPFEGLSLLDIGCGGGLICEPMARLGAHVTGIDASEKNIKTARVHAQETGLTIDYRATTAEDLVSSLREASETSDAAIPNKPKEIASSASPSRNDGFDIVLALEIIEHVTDPQSFIASCAQLVKPGGLLIMTTINRTMKSLLMAKIGAEYILRLLPRGTHQWDKFVKPSEMAQGYENNQLNVLNLSGMVLNPLRWEWRLSDTDIDVNYLMVGQKLSS